MSIRSLLFFLILSGSQAALGETGQDTIVFHDGQEFAVIGKYHSERNYFRFPATYQNKLREAVWNLSRHSAGIGIRFRTNSKNIVVRWTVLNEASLPHMPATGVRGVDLYAYTGKGWQYVRTGFPSQKTTRYTLLSQGDGVTREYLLNLPLYDGVESVEIGIDREAQIVQPVDRRLLDQTPVVYYGTSIAQGGCASRPGLAYTNILARWLDRPFINFGFSGNGTIETSVGEAMTEVDAALYVIDCNANTKAELIYDRTLALVKLLKSRRPETPILLVEGFMNESYYINPAAGVNRTVGDKQRELRRAYDVLRKTGLDGLYYREGEGLIGDDHEGTVDGIHPNDIGMLRMAEALQRVIGKIL